MQLESNETFYKLKKEKKKVETRNSNHCKKDENRKT